MDPAPSAQLQLGVLVSGSGTNLQALLDASRSGELSASVRVVISNRPGAYALERAAQAGVPHEVVRHQDFPNREAFEDRLLERLRAQGVEWIALAGFMRVLGSTFLRGYPGRVLNIHPSLLPAFPGLHAQKQALAAGVKLAGATVHVVDEGVDTGPILIQGAVPVLHTDTEETLSQRILKLEHLLYPRALQGIAAGRVQWRDGRVCIVDDSGQIPEPLWFP